MVAEFLRKRQIRRTFQHMLKRYMNMCDDIDPRNLALYLFTETLSAREQVNPEVRLEITMMVACARGIKDLPDCSVALILASNNLLRDVTEGNARCPLNETERALLEEALTHLAGV